MDDLSKRRKHELDIEGIEFTTEDNQQFQEKVNCIRIVSNAFFAVFPLWLYRELAKRNKDASSFQNCY